MAHRTQVCGHSSCKGWWSLLTAMLWKSCWSLILRTIVISLSRLNHWLPRHEAHPEVMQGTADFHYDIADTLFPQPDPIFHDAATFDTAVHMLDPEPAIV